MGTAGVVLCSDADSPQVPEIEAQENWEFLTSGSASEIPGVTLAPDAACKHAREKEGIENMRDSRFCHLHGGPENRLYR